MGNPMQGGKQASNMWRERQAENLRTRSKVQRHHEEWAQGLDEMAGAEPKWQKALPNPTA